MPPTATAGPPPPVADAKTPPKPKKPPVKPFEFSVPVRTVRDTLRILKAAIVSRSTLPILGSVMIERDGRITRFTATDLDIILSHNLAVEEVEPVTELGRKLLEARHARCNGRVAVEHHSLTNLLKGMDLDGNPLPEMQFRCRDGDFSFSYPICGRTVDDARCVDDPDAFPPVHPLVSPEPTVALPESIRTALMASLPFASTDETRYTLNGVFLDAGRGAVVATDGRAMLVTTVPMPFKQSLVVPTATVKTLQGLWRAPALDITEISVIPIKDEKDAFSVRFDIGSSPVPRSPRLWTLTSKTIDGNFPNWQQVIPETTGRLIELSAPVLADFLASVPRLPKAKDGDNFDPVDITLRNNTVLRIATLEAAYVEHPVHSTGKPAKLVQVRLARDFLMRAFKLGLRNFGLTDALAPVVFSEGARRMIAMPIRAT